MCTVISVNCKKHYFGRNLDYEHDFGEKVTLDLRCPTEHVKALCDELTELTSGQLKPEIGEEEYLETSGAKA